MWLASASARLRLCALPVGRALMRPPLYPDVRGFAVRGAKAAPKLSAAAKVATKRTKKATLPSEAPLPPGLQQVAPDPARKVDFFNKNIILLSTTGKVSDCAFLLLFYSVSVFAPPPS